VIAVRLESLPAVAATAILHQAAPRKNGRDSFSAKTPFKPGHYAVLSDPQNWRIIPADNRIPDRRAEQLRVTIHTALQPLRFRTRYGCKTVVGSRLKQSGMFSTVRGTNTILALRCSHLNGERQEARAAA